MASVNSSTRSTSLRRWRQWRCCSATGARRGGAGMSMRMSFRVQQQRAGLDPAAGHAAAGAGDRADRSLRLRAARGGTAPRGVAPPLAGAASAAACPPGSLWTDRAAGGVGIGARPRDRWRPGGAVVLYRRPVLTREHVLGAGRGIAALLGTVPRGTVRLVRPGATESRRAGTPGGGSRPHLAQYCNAELAGQEHYVPPGLAPGRRGPPWRKYARATHRLQPKIPSQTAPPPERPGWG